jgi:hypothetical protein
MAFFTAMMIISLGCTFAAIICALLNADTTSALLIGAIIGGPFGIAAGLIGKLVYDN